LDEITVNIVNMDGNIDNCINIWRDIYNLESCLGMSSPEWIESLMSVYYRENRNGFFCVANENNMPIGITYFNNKRNIRNYIIYSNDLSLNSSGDSTADMIWIEHNQICSSPTRIEAVARAIMAFLLEQKNWDEAKFPGVIENSALSKIIKNYGYSSEKLIVDKKWANYVVDLKRLRENRMEYLGMLSSEFRYTVKKILRHFEAVGPSSLTQSGSVEEGLDWMNEIGRLSISRMRSINNISSFENEKFVRFHEDYIKKAYPAGRVLLQKFKAGDNVIGYHYNILCGKRIYFYQCGYNYDNLNKISPGIYCHYHNILWAAINNYDIYDFLAGDQQYKRSFANTSTPEYMEWLVLRRQRNKFKVEDNIRNIRNMLKAYVTSQATISG